MTGLILKDLLYLRRTARILLALGAFYLIMFLAAGSADASSGMLAMVVVLLTMILSMNAFAYDELAKWRLYEGSLPVSAGRAVFARYLTALIFSTGLALLSLLLESFAGLTQETALVLLGAWSAALLICAVLFPIIYKFGLQKARLVLIAVALLPTFGALLLKKLNLTAPSEAGLKLLLGLLPPLAAVLFLLSCQLSSRIYAKKED